MSEEQLTLCKKLLRSVLVPEKEGIPLRLIGKMYTELIQEPLPYRAFGFSSEAEFVIKKMPDVARVTTNVLGEKVFMAVANEETAHIVRMVSCQRRSKKTSKQKKIVRRPLIVTRSKHHATHFTGASTNFTHGHGKHVLTGDSLDKGMSGNVAHRKGILGSAPPRYRQGILGDAPAGQGILGAGPAGKGVTYGGASGLHMAGVVPLAQSHHHKPTSTLYGGPQQSKKPAHGPPYLPPKAFGAGDGHQMRKSSGGVGTSHTKKLPARDNITVRCTWENNLVSSPERTVSKRQSAVSGTSSQNVYRAPTPPLSVTDSEFSSSDLRHNLNRLSLNAPQKNMSSGDSSAIQISPSVTPSDEEIRIWLKNLIAGKQAGLWSMFVDQEYQKTFGQESLEPFAVKGSMWPDIVDVQRVNDKRAILYPVAISDDSIPLFSKMPAIEKEEPEKLELPKSPSFCAYVCFVKSATNISIRVVGDEYSGMLETLEEQLERVERVSLRCPKAGMVCMALVHTELEDGSSEDVCLRARVLEVSENQVHVLLLDHSAVEVVSHDRVFNLPLRFNQLPYQAVRCTMTGLESCDADDYTFSLLETVVLGKTCLARVDQRRLSSSSDIFVTLEDIDTGVNLNESVLTSLLSPRIPKVGETSAVVLTYVSASGEISYQSDGPGRKRLFELEELYLAADKFRDELHPMSHEIKLGQLYAVVSSFSSSWSRASVIEIRSKQKVIIKFVDYGDSEEIDVGKLRSLPHDDLIGLPPQAVSCQLCGLPPQDAQWSQRAAEWLMDSAICCSIKVMTDSPLTVDLLTPDGSQSLVEQMATMTVLWDRVEESYETVEVKLAEIGNGENVYVTWTEDPSNFYIVPLRYADELRTVMASLQMFCNGLSAVKVTSTCDLVVGQLCAVYFETQWYRAVIKSVPVLSLLVLVKFVDFGDSAMVDLKDIRKLPTRFQQLPCLAVNAKLSGVGPRNGDSWTKEVKAFFSQYVVDKTFIVYVELVADGVEVTTLPATETCWTVVLVESLPNKTFIYLHSYLASSCPDVQKVKTNTVKS